MRGYHVLAPLRSREARTVKNGHRGRCRSAFREQVGRARESKVGKDAYVATANRLNAKARLHCPHRRLNVGRARHRSPARLFILRCDIEIANRVRIVALSRDMHFVLVTRNRQYRAPVAGPSLYPQ